MTEPKASPSGTSPVYIPWKTFANYVSSLKTTTVPHVLDNTVKPGTMAGNLWRQLTSALQFLGLIDERKVVKEAFNKLVKSSGTNDWPKVLKECVVPAYSKIVEGVPLANATSGQLQKAFKEKASVDGQMYDKCFRFYLHALKEAGVPYSSLLVMRKDSGPRKPRASKMKPKPDKDKVQAANSNAASEKDNEDATPVGTIVFPLPFKGKTGGSIRVPNDVSSEDIKVLELTVNVIKAYAAQKNAVS